MIAGAEPAVARCGVIVAAVALGVAAGPLAWWVVGDLSLPGPRASQQAEYGPYAVPSWLEYALGGLTAVAALAAVLFLVRAARADGCEWRCWLTTALLMAAGGCTGWTWRYLTAYSDERTIDSHRTQLFAVGVMGPVFVSALLFGAVLAGNPRSSRTRSRLLVWAVMAFPALIAAQSVLSLPARP